MIHDMYFKYNSVVDSYIIICIISIFLYKTEIIIINSILNIMTIIKRPLHVKDIILRQTDY